jgi:arabinose-5-phosphate isomerase
MSNQLLTWAKELLDAESRAITACAESLDQSFDKACELIINCTGKIICCGLGKSGHIARKISATMSSTGTPSYYLHPSEALHGDLGTMSSQDLLIAFSQSGETDEIAHVTSYAQRLGVDIVGISGNPHSSLSKISSVHLSSQVDKEACPLNLAPTTSSTVAIALGDALAVAVMKYRGTSEKDFARWHPAGSLAKKFVQIQDIMVPSAEITFVWPEDNIVKALDAVANGNFGICGVLSHDQELIGVVSDGDVRRILRAKGKSAFDAKVSDFMSGKPKRIDLSSSIASAIQQMEVHKVTALFVFNGPESANPIGIIRLHDLMDAKIV